MLIIKDKSINLLHILVIVVTGLILTLPVVLHGVFNAQDLIPFHLKWSKHFAEQFWIGELYPRWLLNMNAGLGSPTFFFYAPIPYYFTSLLHPLFYNDLQGWYPISLSASFALVASGLTAYLWLKSITNSTAALMASLLYIALPYHLAVDLYWRFAFAEYWSFVWIPLILYFSKKIITSKHNLSIAGFAISCALLIMTHVFTFVMFSIVPIFYILLATDKQHRKKALIRTTFGMLLAIGLAAIYWLPAMTTQGYVSMSAILEKEYFYGNNFLFLNSVFDENKDFNKYVEILTLLMGGVAICAFLITRSNFVVTIKKESNYWISVAILALFMTLPLSQPLWYVLPVVQKIQFPWRFNTVLLVATTTLLALGIFSLKDHINFSRKNYLGMIILLAVSLILAVIETIPILTYKLLKLPSLWINNTVLLLAIIAFLALVASSLKYPVDFSERKPFIIGTLLVVSLLLSSCIVIPKCLYNPSKDVDIALEISRDALEYRPRWVSPQIFDQVNVRKLGRSSPKVSISGEKGSLLIQRWQPRNIELQVNVTTDVWLTIHQFYYPGWTARLEDESHILPVQPSESEGLLRVGIPKGKHKLIVSLNAEVEERAGQLISAVSAIITAVFLTVGFRKLKQDNVSYGLTGH